MEQNALNLSKSALLYADATKKIVASPCQTVAADVDRS